MHIALIDEIHQTHQLPRRGTAERHGIRVTQPGRHGRAIRSAVERLRVVVGPATHLHRTSPAAPGSGELEAELARERDRLHELRSTVSGLVASYRLLQEHSIELTPAARSRLEHLHDTELGRLERLLIDRPCSAPGPVDLELAIDPLVETLRVEGHPVAWSGTTLRAWGCEDDVAQVVHVLLDNAVRHASGDQIEVTVARRGQNVEVRVRDHGPGVAPEVRDDLFERGVHRQGSPGEGIGLHIAHELADRMGAVLRLEPGDADLTGSTFVLSLPATPDASSRAGALG